MKELVARVRPDEQDEQGAALSEYALLVASITVVCEVAVTPLGTQVSTAYSENTSTI